AYENMRDAQQSGLDYVELRFSPYFMARAHNLNLQAVVAAVINGVKDASHTFAVKANVIGTLSRTYGQRACMAELNALLAYKDDICALDLAGDELRYPAQQFVEHFSKARDAGWNITVHAGEADGPQSIWQAINLLGAKRIGHGVAATQDPKLMAYMAKHAIAVESCPTSNYQTSTISNIGDHPMKLFIEQGMLVTLNTDDPGVSNIDLRHEYNVAHKILGLSPEALQQIQSNGVLAAFLPEPDKQALWDKKSPK
ncbi:MAG: adenosine deaminase, partial [Paraglaciecola sp.]